MSFPRYPNYRHSGEHRLGLVPEHWKSIRLKNVLQQRVTDGPHTTPSFLDEGVPFLSVDGIQEGELRFDGCRFVSHEDHAEFKRKAAPRRNDILMGKAASTGKIARVKVDFEFSIWSPLALIRINSTAADPAFVEYALKCPVAQAQVDNFCTYNTQKNISMDDIPRLVLACPPLVEQAAIATFLDHETAKIDTLVEEQKRLIELLKEKRQAVISHAVTKGLNPNAPMKDSGVEWLGEVPAHWHVLPLKYFADIGNGSTPNRDRADYWCPTGFPWLSSTVVNQDEVTQADEFVTALALAECHLPRVQPPAILIGITGQGRTRGMATTLMIEATINQHIAYARPRGETIKLGYLRRLFDMAYSKLRADSEAGGSTKAAITCDQIANLRFPVPPAAEQDEVAQAIALAAAKFDALTEEATQTMSLLQERRTALISAAVTGKIDVRRAGAEASV